MKLQTKTGSKNDIAKAERALILGGYSEAEKVNDKDLQPFEYIRISKAEAGSDVEHKISWLE